MRKKLALLTLGGIGFTNSLMAQNTDVATSIQSMYDTQIKPIINVVVLIAISISAVYAAFQFFQGKREGYKTIIYIIVGALIIKFLPELLFGILGNS